MFSRATASTVGSGPKPKEQKADVGRDGRMLGEIVIDDADFPWLSGRFVPEPVFAEVEPWFVETLAFVEAERYDRFEDAYDRIARTLTLVSPSGPVAEFLLHIQGGQAWFRWSDEPFEDT